MHRADSLIRTKLHQPITRPGLVSRPRLQEQIRLGLCGPLTLVVAPAGFGKTTLVASSVTGCTHPVAWLSLDKNDNQAGRFLRYLVAALCEAGASIEEGTQRLASAPEPAPAEAVLTGLINNLEACVLLLLGGASFGILTIFILSLNGILIGSIMEIVHKDHSFVFVAAAILPHGVFEIPAFILSGALGILLAQSLIAEWYHKGDAAGDAGGYARLFILYVVPLVVIAAFVEAFITPVIIHLVA